MTPNDSSTSLGLLQGARDADAQSWHRLREQYAPLVVFWCRRSGLSVHDSEDISQEVFGAVLRGLKTFRRTTNFRSWLRTITINKIRDFVRGAQGRPNAVGGSSMAERLEEVAFPEPHSADAITESDVLLARLLEIERGNVSATTWQAFWRLTIDSAPLSVVAEEMGISEGAARQAKYRLLQRIRSSVETLDSQTH
jgi:RNA polymerase sigma-70 factor (ECF subfamily)